MFYFNFLENNFLLLIMFSLLAGKKNLNPMVFLAFFHMKKIFLEFVFRINFKKQKLTKIYNEFIHALMTLSLPPVKL